MYHEYNSIKKKKPLWSKWSKEMVEMILLARNIGANHQKNKRVKLDIMKAQNFINIIVLMY